MNDVFIPFDILPEGKNWQIGASYRVKMFLKQKSTQEDGAMFQIVDATSLESADRGKQRFLSSEGTYIPK